jgi:UDPglucose--hexose-1-phosphate uridylyltransferase
VSERRLDPTTGEWTTFARHRQDRTFLPSETQCPLCPTHEGGPPTEIPRPAYDIAVFDNRFPSFMAAPPAASVPGSEGFPVEPARGAAEVVVYSDSHTLTMAAMDVERIERIIAVWADRYGELTNREEVGYVLIFENKGVEMGVTLHHPHGQIYGFPDVPPRPLRELQAARAYRKTHGTCIFCDVVAKERFDGVRVVDENPSFLAFVPFAARFPYEVHIAARRHAPSLLDLSDPERRELARLLKRVLAGYDRLFGFPMPYVMALHQAPTDQARWQMIAHFHIELYPPYRTAGKLKYLAGSELGGGAFMNDVLPEAAAAALREAVKGL